MVIACTLAIALLAICICSITLMSVSSRVSTKPSTVGSSSSKVAIPRSKSKSGSQSIGGLFGQTGMIQRLFREVKISFCSELEALSLQLTRPVADAISMTSMEDIINFVNLEYDNPQLMISLLVKFSRKFAETNIYTKLKSILVLHKLMQCVKEDAKLGLLQSVRSLRVETDEKCGSPFFCTDSVEQSAAAAATVAELEAAELARVYSSYVFEYIDTKGILASAGSSRSVVRGGGEEDLLQLLRRGEEVEVGIKRNVTPLGKQCLEAVREDREWLIGELKREYRQSTSTSVVYRGQVEAVLSKYDSKFVAITQAAPPDDDDAVIAEQQEVDADLAADSKEETLNNTSDAEAEDSAVPVRLVDEKKSDPSPAPKKKKSKRTAITTATTMPIDPQPQVIKATKGKAAASRSKSATTVPKKKKIDRAAKK